MFHIGPLNKSLFTQELELVTKCMLQAFETPLIYTKDSIDNLKPEFHVTFDDIDINMSFLYKKANFSHLQLDAKDSENFMSHLKSNLSYGDDKAFFKNVTLTVPVMDDFTPAETKAIRDYTRFAYLDINRILHGTKWAESLKEAMIEGVFVASGINKIMPSQEDVYTFRGEASISTEQLQQRIELVNQGGGITHEPAFMSTSLDSTVSMFYLDSTNKSMIIFEEAYGKNITNLSHYHDEQEFLLGPTTVLWDGYEYKEGIHFFHARVVSPLETQEEPTAEDCDTFSRLLTWASDHGVATDFVTPYVKNQIEQCALDPSRCDNNAHENKKAPILSDVPFIGYEKSDWLACIDKLFARHHDLFKPRDNACNEIFAKEDKEVIISLDEVITNNIGNPHLPSDNTTVIAATLPFVPPVELVPIENIMCI